MAKTILSILTQEKWLEEQLCLCIDQSNYALGAHGNCENEILNFIISNPMADHVLLIKPTPNYSYTLDESFLRKSAKIDVAIIGGNIPVEHKPLVQRSNISAYISYNELSSHTINELIFNLQKNGFYFNEQIPKGYWNKRPKPLQDYCPPQFTQSEKSILKHLCHGFSNAEIAELTQSSLSNIQNHLHRIKQKAMVNSSIELVAISISNNWVTLERNQFKRRNPFIMKFSK